MNLRMALMVMIGMSLLVFGACMNLGTFKSTAARFYLLESNVEPMMATGSQGRLSNLSLGIGPVIIASYLDRPQLVSRLSGNELRVDEFRLWAEPLKANISRVIRENLSVLTDAGHVYSYPIKRATIIDYQISLNVLRFDADAAGSVTLKSVWRIVEPDSHQGLMERRSTIVKPSSSTAIADVVDAMSMALAELSKEMAQALVDGLPR